MNNQSLVFLLSLFLATVSDSIFGHVGCLVLYLLLGFVVVAIIRNIIDHLPLNISLLLSIISCCFLFVVIVIDGIFFIWEYGHRETLYTCFN